MVVSHDHSNYMGQDTFVLPTEKYWDQCIGLLCKNRVTFKSTQYINGNLLDVAEYRYSLVQDHNSELAFMRNMLKRNSEFHCPLSLLQKNAVTAVIGYHFFTN